MSTTTSCGAMPRQGSNMRVLYLFIFSSLTSRAYALPSGPSPTILSTRMTAELQTDGFTLVQRSETEGTLSKGAAAGIVVGVIVAGSIVLSVVWVCLRRKKSATETETNVEHERGHERAHENDTDSEKLSTTSLTDTTAPAQPQSSISRLMSKVTLPARASSQRKNPSVDKTVPIEAPDNEIFELAATRPPVELDGDTGSSDDFWIIDHEVGFGLDEAYPMSQYEQTKLKMDRQLAGPVPAYTPGDWDQEALEKKGQDTKDGYDGEQQESLSNLNSPEIKRPASGACVDPSPLSPHNTWSTHISQMPSPMSMASSAVTPKFPPAALTRGNSSGTYRERSLELNLTTRSNSVPTSSSSSDRGSSRVQRTPINPTEVVCLGPIPENVMLPGQTPTTDLIGPDGFNLVLPTFQPSDDPAEDTLGSNFTIEEDARIAEVLETVRTLPQADLAQKLQSRWSSATKGTSMQSPQISSPLPTATVTESGPALPTTTEEPIRQDRIDPALDLIHVPQIPTQRYSWEGSTPH